MVTLETIKKGRELSPQQLHNEVTAEVESWGLSDKDIEQYTIGVLYRGAHFFPEDISALKELY